ncbi:hypothetical protein fugu_014452 [Takifugu bimaculatus]|uniref:Receptor-interacting serine/threonine-protein kinase 1 n=1 Tax=Takifugu bimaculatus TaxID=433685 RepID=A0A4Z2C321_9TELE|nr:hypothetical protein fugu_014452 [Takifugu bimaculatus]
MAAAPQLSLHMRSTDLIRKEPLDYGGFGDVYLCLHVTLGQVVMKTIYTGPLHSKEKKKLLIDEGSIMASLNHERVVKLLGVILEDRDCSLVMELIPRGNLLVMLQTVSVPLSVKGRVTLEILEAMVYLSENDIIHKDIKPENILVDQDFHIKIADLGLAVSQAWSKLTKEESRRKSRQTTGERGAGTLSYMAPEHLESIHAASTEKSDVYSFAIVLWVILAGVEPYANARSEDQICQCVRKGDRPAEDLIPKDTPGKMIHLMKWSWQQDPRCRPTFKEAYDFLFPFYMETLAPCVEEDLLKLRMMYEGPEYLVEKMKSLSLSCSLGDCPAPLMSSDSVSVPVEASIEDLHYIQSSQRYIQGDARAASVPQALEEKLNQELQYHQGGNYNSATQADAAKGYLHSSTNPFLPNLPDLTTSGQDGPPYTSSVQSFTKAAPVHPTSQEDHPSADPSQSMNSTVPSKPHLSSSVTMPLLPQLNQEHPHSLYTRQQSCPTFPATDAATREYSLGSLLAPSKSRLQDPGSLFIQNASGIQIGSNNKMSIKSGPSWSLPPSSSDSFPFYVKEGVQKYGDHAVTEEHLDLLKENIGAKWKQIARRLGLTDTEIETIEHDFHRDGLTEMVHQMLERWKMKEGSIGYTIGKLLRALDGNINVELIKKILNTCG